MIGKKIRMERIMNRETGKIVIVPMDHGVTVGPINGLENIASTVDKVAEGGANAIVLHKGLVEHGYRGSGKDIGLIVHLSASTSLNSNPNYKVLVCTVEEAVSYGADAVSVHVNVGAENQAEMLRDMGYVVRDCNRFGIPLLAMMYPRGPKIENEKDVEVVRHAARVGAELGADIVKTNYTGDPKSFGQVVDGCPVPVVIAGGSKKSDHEALKMIYDAVQAGAAGVALGRNAFQHDDPTKLVKAVCSIVHEGKTVEEANETLKLFQYDVKS